MNSLVNAALVLGVMGLISFGLMIAMADAAAKQRYPRVALYFRVVAWTTPLQIGYILYQWNDMGAFNSR